MLLWFAWKFVPLWYQQQLNCHFRILRVGCDLLENSYLCGISNNDWRTWLWVNSVVICLKIRTFVVSATTTRLLLRRSKGCDLLENSYLCGISNNFFTKIGDFSVVVICLKIRTFVVSATTARTRQLSQTALWFAWKFVPLWYQQQQFPYSSLPHYRCDLLENSYLCGISNNRYPRYRLWQVVVICLKIRTFVVSATTVLIYSLA